MLDEVALRKPEFQEGVRVKLGDGQEWSFPLPKLRMVPKRNGTGEIVVDYRIGPGYGSTIQKSFALFWTPVEEEPENAWQIRFAAAADLLQKNYSITDDDLADLIYLDRADPESLALWHDISMVLAGVGRPKPSPATSDSPVE
jgi:hypothetical protein